MSSLQFDSPAALAALRAMLAPILVIACGDTLGQRDQYQHNVWSAATNAARSLTNRRGLPERLAYLPGDDFHTSNRPVLSAGRPRFTSDVELFIGTLVEAGQSELVVLTGPEPALRYRLFVDRLYAFLCDYRIRRVVEFTARLSQRPGQISPIVHQPGFPNFSAVASDLFQPRPKPDQDSAEAHVSGLAPWLHEADRGGAHLDLRSLELEIPQTYTREQADHLSSLLVDKLRRLVWDAHDDPLQLLRPGSEKS